MGAAIDAFGVTTDAMKRNPVLLGAAALVGVGGTVLGASGQTPIPLLGLLVGLVYFFFEPLLAGGYLGMADEAVDGETNFDTFVESAKENYTDLLVARLLVAVPLYVYAFVVGIVGVFVLAMGGAAMGMSGTAAAGGSSDPTSMLGALGLVTVLFVLVAILIPIVPGFFIQFYPAAIVVGDAGAIESFTHSFKLVKSNVPSVLGYSAVVFVVGLVGLVPALLSGGGQQLTQTFLQGATESPAAGLAGGFLVRILVFVVAFFFVKTLLVFVLRTYYVSFVRSVTDTA